MSGYLFNRPAEVTQHDTNLRFTDILFGFVIFQLFQRLQGWSDFDGVGQLQLVTATVLVLTSWIGFRRSLNRSDYEVKFFNLPFFRFVLDQAMVYLYFRVAVLTPADAREGLPAEIVEKTTWWLVVIFALYALWDALGLWIASANDGCEPKYPKVEDKTKTTKRAERDWRALAITAVALVLFAILHFVADFGDKAKLAIAIAILVLYRFAKEAKNAWRAQRAAPAESG